MGKNESAISAGTDNFWETSGLELHHTVDDLWNTFFHGDLFTVFQGQNRLRRAFHENNQIGVHIDFLSV
jgi:hypothetical protein